MSELTLGDGSGRKIRVENGRPIFTCGDLVAAFGHEGHFVLVRRVADGEPMLWITDVPRSADEERRGIIACEARPAVLSGGGLYGGAEVSDVPAFDLALAWLAPLPLAARAQYVIDDLAATPPRDDRPVADRALALARSFPSLRDVVGAAWDPVALARFLVSAAVTSGSKHAALFVLEIWNGCCGLDYCPDCWELVEVHARGIVREHKHGPRGCIGAGKPARALRFRLSDAIGTWDAAHRAAFRAWAQDPFTL